MRIAPKVKLKTLLMLTTCICVSLAVLDVRTRRQQSVVREVASRGGETTTAGSLPIDQTYACNFFRTAKQIELPTIPMDQELTDSLRSLSTLGRVEFTEFTEFDQQKLEAFRASIPNVDVCHPIDPILEAFSRVSLDYHVHFEETNVELRCYADSE